MYFDSAAQKLHVTLGSTCVTKCNNRSPASCSFCVFCTSGVQTDLRVVYCQLQPLTPDVGANCYRVL